MKAIIPAAGKGTRFLPASKAVPKEMLPVLSKPAIQYVVEEALAADASEVVIICNDDKPEIAQHFSPDPALVSSLEEKGNNSLAESVRHAGELPVSFAEQPEALGLGHAVHCAASFVAANDEGFYVLLGDVLVPEGDLLRRMYAVSKARGNASVIAVMSVPLEEVSRFGIIDAELIEGAQQEGAAIWQIRALVEKPAQEEAPSNLAIFGRYLLTPAVMQILAHTAPGAGGEIQLTDALVELLKTEALYAVEVGPSEGFDCGTIADWLATNIRLAAKDSELAEAIKAAGANLC